MVEWELSVDGARYILAKCGGDFMRMLDAYDKFEETMIEAYREPGYAKLDSATRAWMARHDKRISFYTRAVYGTRHEMEIMAQRLNEQYSNMEVWFQAYDNTADWETGKMLDGDAYIHFWIGEVSVGILASVFAEFESTKDISYELPYTLL